MKQIISVDINSQKAGATDYKGDLIAVGVFANEKKPSVPCQALDDALDGAISRVMKLQDFEGKQNTNALLYTNQKLPADRVLLVGLGEKKHADIDTLRKAAAYTANTAVNMKAKTLALALHQAFTARTDPRAAAGALAEGTYFGSYRYDEFVTDEEQTRPGKLAVTVIDSDTARLRKIAQGLKTGTIIGKAQSYARTLANRPGNVIDPPALAAEAKKLARTTPHLKCTVFGDKQLADKKMGGIIAVGSGSKSKPRFIILDYAGDAKNPKKTIALVGKAITFDSGGISIKPSAHMQQMKFDKSGGIAVLATIKAAAELKLKVNICALIPEAENLPGGASYRPGDIIQTYSGKTVEVQNTDAEGRMILCDALAYAARHKCNPIIDVATLTGACIVALGKHHAGLMGNDDSLIKRLQKAAQKSGEKVWHLPSGEEYAEEMKSKIADLKNIGGRWGGACTGAAFLGQFVDDAKWAHLDIAGMDMFEKATPAAPEGSIGFGVRLLTAYLMDIAGPGR